MKFYEESCYFQPVILVISGLRMIIVNLRDIYNSESNMLKLKQIRIVECQHSRRKAKDYKRNTIISLMKHSFIDYQLTFINTQIINKWLQTCFH